MAITRAQQFRQMLEDGGMLVQPGFGGTRQGYKKSFESQNRDKQKNILFFTTSRVFLDQV